MITDRKPKVHVSKWYSISHTQRSLGISRRTVYRFMERGHLRFKQTENLKHRKISGQEILRLWECRVLGIVS